MTKKQWKMNSTMGPIYLVASEKGLTGIFWKKQEASTLKSLTGSSSELNFLKETQLQLTDYLKGERKTFDLTLDLDKGTDFQKQVWKQLSKISYGKTLSYSDVAQKIKNEKAVRAVGSANGKNPFSIVVPCHRVIAADGTLGGYAGGLKVKQQLLALEKN